MSNIEYSSDGTKMWRLCNGDLHRDDGPAVEDANGDREWFVHGRPHREDGPAVIKADGSKRWYLNGELHREQGPAVEDADGYQEWRINDDLHREDGPAIIDVDGRVEWHLNGQWFECLDEWAKALSLGQSLRRQLVLFYERPTKGPIQ